MDSHRQHRSSARRAYLAAGAATAAATCVAGAQLSFTSAVAAPRAVSPASASFLSGSIASSAPQQTSGISTATGAVAAVVLATGAAAARRNRGRAAACQRHAEEGERVYSIADQVARFERAKKEDNRRYLDIGSVYDGSFLKGKRLFITGGNRGLGLLTVQQAVKDGAKCVVACRGSSKELDALGDDVQVITGVDVQSTESVKKMAEQIEGGPLDYAINNAGYFMEAAETLSSLDDKEELKQIDICALGPLRVTSALHGAGLLKGGKVIIITSQAGSVEWRFTQNAGEGGDYGHHMSRAACNIAGALMSEELKGEGIPITMLHPGFNRTDMTAKYSDIWDKEGAVPPEEGAMRVLYEVGNVSMETTGKCINCEDGLQIPW